MALGLISRYYRNSSSTPYVGYIVSVTATETNSPVRIYMNSAGSLLSDVGETVTDSGGQASFYVDDQRSYRITFRHPQSRQPLVIEDSVEAATADVIFSDPNGGTGGGGPLSAQWTDASRVALVGPGDLPVRVGIDTYTWAELQTAYPNNGAALLALPANTMVFVSNWQALFVRNAAGTYWVPVGGVVMLDRLAAKVTHTGTVAETAVYTYTIPAGLMTPTSGLRWRAGFIAAGGNTGGTTMKWKFGATQIDSNSVGVGASLSPITQYRNAGATNVGAYDYNLTYCAATTFETSGAWNFSITLTLNSSADSTVLHMMDLELI